jgi:hypothetical protein
MVTYIIEAGGGRRQREKNPFRPDTVNQGCQMVQMHTKDPNLGISWKGLGMENVGIFYSHVVF